MQPQRQQRGQPQDRAPHIICAPIYPQHGLPIYRDKKPHHEMHAKIQRRAVPTHTLAVPVEQPCEEKIPQRVDHIEHRLPPKQEQLRQGMQNQPPIHRIVMGAHGSKNISDMLHPLICRAKDKAIVKIIGNQCRLQVKCIKKGRATSGNRNKNRDP